MALLRRLLGDALRHERQAQSRTLRDVSASARVSLGYLSEVERGQKEASSELLASICQALDIRLSQVLRDVSDELALIEPSLPGRLVASSKAAATEPVVEPAEVAAHRVVAAA